MEIAPGITIGDWQLETRLGGGAFGSVWRARQIDTGDIVAIKLLTGILASDERSDIRREIEVLAGMASTRSPYVVRVLDGGAEPVPHIVMEYVDGSDLAARLHDRGALDPGETIEIGIAIASALAVLKNAGIVHRDVKPANVLIGKDGVARLADFGIAKIIGFETITMTGQLPMTMAYAAPEVWDGRATHQSDLYAMGVLLFQCLAGEPPFAGSYSSLFKQHTTVTPNLSVLPVDIPSHLRALIRACLQKDATARPPDATACVEMLETARRELADPASVTPAADIAFGVASIGTDDSLAEGTGVTTIMAIPHLRDETVVHNVGATNDLVRTAGAPPPPPPRRRTGSFAEWPLGWRFAGIGLASVAAAVIAAAAAFLVFRDDTGATNPDPTSTPAISTTITVTPSLKTSPTRGSVTPTVTPPPGTPHPPSPTPATPPATPVPPTPPPPPPPPPTTTPVTAWPTETATTVPPPPPPPSPTSRQATVTPQPPTPTFTPTPTATVPPPPPPPPPVLVVVDDIDGGFSHGGGGATCPSPGLNNRAYNFCWGTAGYGGHYWYTWNNSGSADQNWGQWTPNLSTAATYRVCAYIPPDHAYTHGARYQIHHNGGVAQITINQQPLTGWIDLGAYGFPSGSGGYVYLGDATGESWASTQIGYDAMKWVPNGGGC